jgi:hypothetical protein
MSVELTKDAGTVLLGEPSRKDDGDRKDKDKDQTEDQSQSDYHWKRQNNKDKEKAGDTGASGMPVGTARAAEPMDATTPPPVAPTATPPPALLSMGCTRFTRRS